MAEQTIKGGKVQMTDERWAAMRRDFGPDAPAERPVGWVAGEVEIGGSTYIQVNWVNVPAEALRDMSVAHNPRHLERAE